MLLAITDYIVYRCANWKFSLLTYPFIAYMFVAKGILNSSKSSLDQIKSHAVNNLTKRD